MKSAVEMSEFEIQPIQKFEVDLEVPGDKSMSHRAAMIAGLAFLVAVPVSIWVNWSPEAADFAIRIGIASGVAYIVGQLGTNLFKRRGIFDPRFIQLDHVPAKLRLNGR